MQLVLYGKPDCLLCDRLEAMLGPHLHTLGPAATLIKRDINDDSSWYESYWDRIPVLMHGDRVLLEGRPTQKDVDSAFVEILESLSS